MPSGRLLALGLALAACSSEAEVELPPNVILISLDTVRPDHLSVYGYERETTPFLEELAGASVRYTRAYAPSSWTLTSHMSMLTGVYPSSHRVSRETSLSTEIPLLAERLRDAGYFTAAVFRYGWISERHGFDRGFDVFESAKGVELAAREMREVVEERPRNRPLFLFLHLFDAHCGNLQSPTTTMYDVPDEYEDFFREGAAERMRGEPIEDLYHGRIDPTPEQAEDLVALYGSGIRYLDDKIARWFQEWRRSGLLDGSLVIVTSDHGEALGDHSAWNGHGGLRENGLRVPLLVRYPDLVGAGTTDDRLTSSVDLVPTVLDLVGLDADPWLIGRSLRAEPRPADAAVIAETARARTVVGRDWKLRTARNGDPIALWNLADDPGETTRLAPTAEPAPAQDLRARLERLDERIDAAPGEPLPARTLSDIEASQLEAVGYVE